MLWIQIFDSIWVLSRAKGYKLLSFKLLGVKLGYLWSLAMIVCAIAVCGYIGALWDGRINLSQMNIQDTIHFLTYGPWVYLLYVFIDFQKGQLNIRPFLYSFNACIFLLIIVNLGVSLHGYYVTNLGYHPAGVDIAILILSQYCGLFAIAVIIFYGYNWYYRQEMGQTIDGTSDLEENRE